MGNSDEDEVIIGDNALIRSGSIIYSDVKIGNGFKTGHRAFIRENSEIGDNVLIGTNTVLDGHCKLGNNVFIGPRVVTTNDKYMQTGAKLIGPTIKKGARIGANSTILPGVVIGEGAVVGSGSVVTKDVAPGKTVAGNPARELKRKI
jgi:acetyltransferase-like isoleucine patch superfamily enzyme